MPQPADWNPIAAGSSRTSARLRYGRQAHRTDWFPNNAADRDRGGPGLSVRPAGRTRAELALEYRTPISILRGAVRLICAISRCRKVPMNRCKGDSDVGPCDATGWPSVARCRPCHCAGLRRRGVVHGYRAARTGRTTVRPRPHLACRGRHRRWPAHPRHRDMARSMQSVLKDRTLTPCAKATLALQVLEQLIHRQLVLTHWRRWAWCQSAPKSTRPSTISGPALRRRTWRSRPCWAAGRTATKHCGSRWPGSWPGEVFAAHLTDALLKAQFDAHRRDFDGTEVRVSHILLRPRQGGASQAR